MEPSTQIIRIMHGRDCGTFDQSTIEEAYDWFNFILADAWKFGSINSPQTCLHYLRFAQRLGIFIINASKPSINQQ